MSATPIPLTQASVMGFFTAVADVCSGCGGVARGGGGAAGRGVVITAAGDVVASAGACGAAHGDGVEAAAICGVGGGAATATVLLPAAIDTATEVPQKLQASAVVLTAMPHFAQVMIVVPAEGS